MADKMAQNNHTIQNSIEFKASAYVLHDIRQVTALLKSAGTKRATRNTRYSPGGKT